MNREPWGPMRRSSRIPFRCSALHSHCIQCFTHFPPSGKHSPRICSVQTTHSAEQPVAAQKQRWLHVAQPVKGETEHARGACRPPFPKHGPVLPQSLASIVGLAFCTERYWTPKCLFLNILFDTGWGFVGTQMNVQCLFLTFLGGSSVASAIVNSDALTIPSA